MRQNHRNRKKNALQRGLSLLLLACLLFSLPPSVFAESGTETETAINPEPATSYIVTYYPGEELDEDLQEDLEEQTETIAELAPETELIEFLPEEDIAQSLEELESDPAVQYVEENQPRYLLEVPNDPQYGSQWGLVNLEAPEAWSIAGTLEENTVVAVIDTGILSTHEDLQGRIAAGGVSFENGVQGANIEDVQGHGTKVAGIIAATANNGVGIAGAAGPLGVTVLPIRIFNSEAKTTAADLIAGIDYAISQGVDVINLSLGAYTQNFAEEAAINRALSAGICVVAAAGNDGEIAPDPDADSGDDYVYPASYNGVISVGSITQANVRSTFSNYNDKVTVMAPGSNILSTNRNGTYSSGDGTSFASPMVAAAAAVLKGEYPAYSPSMIKARMIATAIDMGDAGKDNYYGYGRVNFSDLLRPEAATDGSDGVIDALVFNTDGGKVVTTLGGIDGYAYDFSVKTTGGLYSYLKGTGDAPVVYAILSGTKYMLMNGSDGYVTNYPLYSTPEKAMLSTPEIDETVWQTFLFFRGFDAGGAPILEPYE